MTPRFKAVGFGGFAALLVVVLIVGAGLAVSAALKSYSQAEQRYDAENRVATHLVIRRAKQHAVITRAQLELVEAPQNVDRLRSTPAR
jgi:cytochrome c-type biogenesis protein CcmH/NrfG